MANCFMTQQNQGTIPIRPLLKAHFDSWLQTQGAYIRQWLQTSRFNADPGSLCIVPDAQGKPAQVLVGIATVEDSWIFGDLPTRLPEGQYHIDWVEPSERNHPQWQRIMIAWGLGGYSFSQYLKKNRKPNQPQPQLLIPAVAHPEFCQEMVASINWVRDLINTPTEEMSPQSLADAARELAKTHSASIQVIVGDDLCSAHYPAIHAVGRSSTRPPCLVDLDWGDKQAPLLTLVGKGICFDSGGMNLKSADGMRYMKKDMGGAAHALGLARLIMSQRLPVHLRVLLPVAENMVSGNSYKPGDIITTRAGITVEITNTDAEGRLVLCDALTAAAEKSPDLILDFSTLTGAARVALGPEVAVFFANQETLAKGLIKASEETRDPLWRLPLYQPYERYLKSEVADIANASANSFAGAVTAALYLKQFVPGRIPWAHFDIGAWNFDRLPGRPIGGEAQALQAVYAFLKDRYRT